jgi:hypothetical protein
MELTAMRKNITGINAVLICGLISLPSGLYADELDESARHSPGSVHGAGQHANPEIRAARQAEWQAMSTEEREAAKVERQQRRKQRRQELENMTPEARQQAQAEHRREFKKQRKKRSARKHANRSRRVDGVGELKAMNHSSVGPGLGR